MKRDRYDENYFLYRLIYHAIGLQTNNPTWKRKKEIELLKNKYRHIDTASNAVRRMRKRNEAIVLNRNMRHLFNAVECTILYLKQ